MIHRGLALFGLISSLVLALALGSGWERRIGLILAGAVVFGVATVYSLVTDCAGCTPEIGPWLAAFALFGWLVGIGSAILLRRRTAYRPGGPGVATACVLLLLVAGVIGSGRNAYELARWGCPTETELHRPQSVEEVVAAFARHDVPLEPIPLPAELPEPAYRDALAFRHSVPGAAVYVFVCPRRCAVARIQLEPGYRHRLGLDSSNNVPVLVAETGKRAGTQLIEALDGPLRRVHPYVEYGTAATSTD